MVVLGEKESGKTTLINALISSEPSSIKSTVALDFKYGRKKGDEGKVVGNFFELGGGRSQ